MMETSRRVFSRWAPLLAKFVASRTDQARLLHAIDTAGQKAAAFLPHIGDLLFLLYDRDILEEDPIIDWAHQLRSDISSGLRDARILDPSLGVTSFLQWLEEAEEEDDA